MIASAPVASCPIPDTVTRSDTQWAVALFVARETPDTLAASLLAAICACGDTPSTIAVLVNGNDALAEAAIGIVERLTDLPSSCRIELWNIAPGDKAHAWNVYLHEVAVDADLSFFVDGYAQVRPDAFRLLADALHGDPALLAGTGVPTVGRSAEALRRQMLANGGLHGNLYVFPRHVMQLLKRCGFHLPRGLYRNDSLLGALCNYNFDPAQASWNPRRVLVHPAVSWGLQEVHASPLGWLQGQYKRLLRQAQGTLENIAVRDHFSLRKLAPETLPQTVTALVREWVGRHPEHAGHLFRRHPLTRLAYAKLCRAPAIDSVANELQLLAAQPKA